MSQIKAPKGTKDVLPGQTERWQHVEAKFKEVARRFGFSEIRTPVIEHTELFTRGIGDTTDVVEKQMFTFEDKAGRSITLKPEGTAGVARAYIENALYAKMKPGKLWYEISCFRHENTQLGRLREFHQFGIEIFGSDDMLADAEVIAFADTFFRSLGINDLSLRINSIGCHECRPLYRKQLMEYFAARLGDLCETCKGRYDRNPMRIFDCKSATCQGIAAGAPVMMDSLCPKCETDFQELQENLAAQGVEYEIDKMIVRGLDYYTKTAFEFVSSRIGAQATVCGGGRYDHLMRDIGGEDIPGVGFGLGIERLLLVLEDLGGSVPAEVTPDVLIVFMGEKAKIRALSLQKELRESGLSSVMDVCARNTKGQFKYADKTGARFAVIIGEDELESGSANIKDLQSGEQKECRFADVAETLLALCDKAEQ